MDNYLETLTGHWHDRVQTESQELQPSYRLLPKYKTSFTLDAQKLYKKLDRNNWNYPGDA